MHLVAKAVAGILGIALVSLAHGASDGDRFEVASIKPTRLTGEVVDFRFEHGRFIARNVTLAFLITESFDNIREEDQIINAPRWAFSQKFDVEAKAPPTEADVPSTSAATVAEENAENKRTQARLRSLLEERFGLKVHTQQRDKKGYALVVGKHGAKFLDSRLPDGMSGGLVRARGKGHIEGPSIAMPLLANLIGRDLGAKVSDKTGLAGFFKIDLSWTPDSITPLANGDGTAAQPQDFNGPSIFTAVQKQLGLALIPEKQTETLLVVDKAEQPSAN